MTERAGWFASESDPEDATPWGPYQPFVQVSGGCFPLPIWFSTVEDCERFIREDLIGLGVLDG